MVGREFAVCVKCVHGQICKRKNIQLVVVWWRLAKKTLCLGT